MQAAGRVGEDLATMQKRHLNAMRAVQAPALEAINSKPIQSAESAMRPLAAAPCAKLLLRRDPHGGPPRC